MNESEILSELKSALEWVSEDDNPNGSIAIKISSIRGIIKILEKREPIEPVVHPETKYHYEVRDCGACGYYLSNGANYCPRCGRAVKKRSGDLNRRENGKGDK